MKCLKSNLFTCQTEAVNNNLISYKLFNLKHIQIKLDNGRKSLRATIFNCPRKNNRMAGCLCYVLTWMKCGPNPLANKKCKEETGQRSKKRRRDRQRRLANGSHGRSLGHVNVITLKFMCICYMAMCNMWPLFAPHLDCRMFVCDSFWGSALPISCCCQSLP